MKTIVSEESEEGFFDDKENVYFAASSQSADSPTSSFNVKKARGRRVKGFDRRRWFISLYCSYVFWVQCALMVRGYL